MAGTRVGPASVRVRCVVAGVSAGVLALALVGCGSTRTSGPRAGGSSSVPMGTTGTPSTPASSLLTPASTPTAVTTVAAAPVLAEPGGGSRLLPGRRIVAFYGAAGTPALGVLGTASPEGIWPRLARQAAAYRTPGVPVLPAYELIADVIQGSPGDDGDFEVAEPAATITSYLRAAHAHHALLILDIQPGRSSFLPLAERLAPFLADPDVGLALDPEWRLAPGQVPDRQIGTVSAAEINATSAWLAAFTAARHLPQKLLLVHQFTAPEISDKAAVLARSGLATVFNMDGFGGRGAKLSQYAALARYRAFGLGLKLFYRQDVGIFAPAQALAIRPSPQVIDYE